jgi:hypothetical protein
MIRRVTIMPLLAFVVFVGINATLRSMILEKGTGVAWQEPE